MAGLAIAGFFFCIAGGVYNAGHFAWDDDVRSTDPIFSPVSGTLLGLGAACFAAGSALGWKNQGTYQSTLPPSKEPQSLVMRMPGAKGMGGPVTLRVRNGDLHEFETPAEVVSVLAPGMIGTATIQGRRILAFEPDKEQPNLRTRPELGGVAGNGPEKP